MTKSSRALIYLNAVYAYNAFILEGDTLFNVDHKRCQWREVFSCKLTAEQEKWVGRRDMDESDYRISKEVQSTRKFHSVQDRSEGRCSIHLADPTLFPFIQVDLKLKLYWTTKLNCFISSESAANRTNLTPMKYDQLWWESLK